MDISIVIPCYRSADTLDELTHRLIKQMENIARKYEVIYVHDAGPDNTWEVIQQLSRTYAVVKGINLMRNLGQHRATLCGLSHSLGDVVITLDDDLQHPPEEIPKLAACLKDQPGVDAVFGAYDVKQHSIFRNLGTRVQQRIRKAIFPDAAHIQITSFRAFRRQIVEELLLQRQTNPRIGLMTFSVTTRVKNITVAHHRRKQGASTYSLARLVKTALVPIINYSSLPLRLISSMGAFVTLMSFFTGALLHHRLLYGCHCRARLYHVDRSDPLFNGTHPVFLRYRGRVSQADYRTADDDP